MFTISIDQGTSSTRVFLVNEEGRIVKKFQRRITQIYPKPGWVEHDPNEILETVKDGLSNILEGVNPKDVKGIGITNQRETSVVWDAESGKPLYNAIVWQCRRTAPICEELKRKGLDDLIKDRTGLPLDPYFSGTKIKWLIENVDEVKESLKRGRLRFGTIDSFLIHSLTRERNHLTDLSNASRTMLFNLRTLKWDLDILEYLSIPKDILPEVVDSVGYFGETIHGIPILSVMGDQQSALFGQLCFKEGMVKVTYGTGAFILMNTGENLKKSKKLVSTIAWGMDGKVIYALEGSIFNCGTLIDWLVKVGLVSKPSETEDVAMSLEKNDDVYFVGAFSGLGAPHWDSRARGLFIGLTSDAGREHLVRSVLESIAYSVYEVAKLMEEDSGIELREIRVDGGVSKNNFLMQFQSDILGKEISRPVNRESTAMGVTFAAGVKSGIWKMEELEELRKTDRRFIPDESRRGRLMKNFDRWKEAVKRAMGWAR